MAKMVSNAHNTRTHTYREADLLKESPLSLHELEKGISLGS